MSVFSGLIWGLMAFATMLVTIQYYLPQLKERVRASGSEALAGSAESEPDQDVFSPETGRFHCELFNHRGFAVGMLFLCALLAFWCGSVAGQHSLHSIGLVKMTVAMAVLSCVFITDMELLMVPNLCPIILVVTRGITVICEFIWMREYAPSWLLDSVIALVASLAMLLIMARVTRGGIGMGDVKLFSSLGFLCGIRALCFTLMFAFLICAVVSTGLLVCKKKHLKDALPLGPFIWLGYCVTVLLSIM